MAKRATGKPTTPRRTAAPEDEGEANQINLARFLSQKAVTKFMNFWLIGSTPLICHAWSEKARHQMLEKQVKSTRPGKEARDPFKEFASSLYEVRPGKFGFPATAVKKCILTAAHKDKGIARELVMRSFWIKAPFRSIRPALRDAKCDLPLLRLWGSEPELREDMVKIGKGLNKTANLAYRAQFTTWALRVRAEYNASVINEDVISSLINELGQSCGIGDWRNEKSGPFGAFRLANAEERAAWEAFASGLGPLPQANILDEFEDDFLEAAE